MAWMDDAIGQLMMQMQLQQLMGRDDVINAALPARWSNDIVIQPEMSHVGQGYAPPYIGEFRGDTPPLMGIPPSPWNRPNFDPQQGWRSDPNNPVSDEPPGAKYPSGFLSPAQRGFIKTGSPGQTTVDQLNAFRRSDDNRDMQVRAPGQYQFPSEMFGLLLHPNAAGIYGRGERLPPAGDVVLPPPGYRDESSRNAYMLQPSTNPAIRQFQEGYSRKTAGGDDAIGQLMMQMQLQQLMGRRF